MERLGAKDLRTVLEVARELGEVEDLDRFRASVLGQIQRLVACDTAGFNEIAPDGAEAVIAAVDPADCIFAGAEEILGAYAHQNPLIANYRGYAATGVLKFSDFITRRQLHGLEICDRIEAEHQIAFTLPAPSAHVIGFSLNRKRSDFSERDREVLQAARPFVAQAYGNAVDRALTRATLAALERAADSTAQAVIVLQDSGRIELATRAARYWLRQFAAADERDGLPEPLDSWAAVQRRRATSTSDELHLAEPLSLPTPAGALTALFVAGGREGLDTITLHSSEPALNRSTLRALGLTSRESDVLLLVASGLSNAQIARELALSQRTISKHLEHIYTKLEVTSRTAALARARDLSHG
jgi:DNA-binding NarL/FixJ family response regulator